eukprot:4778183-Pyramimonas_sp.AAC.1
MGFQPVVAMPPPLAAHLNNRLRLSWRHLTSEELTHSLRRHFRGLLGGPAERGLTHIQIRPPAPNPPRAGGSSFLHGSPAHRAACACPT